VRAVVTARPGPADMMARTRLNLVLASFTTVWQVPQSTQTLNPKPLTLNPES